MLFSAITVGTLIGIYCVYAIVFIYKYKGTSKADLVRILGVSSIALVASIGLFFLENILLKKSELTIEVSIIFSLSIIVSLILFFWINKNKIG